MTHAAPRQTRTYLMKRFDEVGIHPKSKYGQNFLIDLNLLDVLIEAGEIGPNDVVLEVGGGTGALTSMLAQKAGHVVSVEIDPQLAQLARELLTPFSNVTMVRQDALKNKSTMAPEVLDAVREKLQEVPGRKFKLAANLPYNVATPILSNLLSSDPTPTSLTATIQKELGERMVALPSTKDYSALSVWMQAQCDVRIVRIMPPTVFWPRPNVDSAIVHIQVNPEKQGRIPDLDYFHSFVRAMFFHRRKFLRSELLAAYKNRLDKPAVDRIMDSLGYAGDARAEQLSVEQMIELCETIRKEVPDWGL